MDTNFSKSVFKKTKSGGRVTLSTSRLLATEKKKENFYLLWLYYYKYSAITFRYYHFYSNRQFDGRLLGTLKMTIILRIRDIPEFSRNWRGHRALLISVEINTDNAKFC